MKLQELDCSWLADHLNADGSLHWEQTIGLNCRLLTVVDNWIWFPVASRHHNELLISIVAVDWIDRQVIKRPVQLKDTTGEHIRISIKKQERPALEIAASPGKQSLHFLTLTTSIQSVLLLELGIERLKQAQFLTAIVLRQSAPGDHIVAVNWLQSDPATLTVLSTAHLRLFDVMGDCLEPLFQYRFPPGIQIMDVCQPPAAFKGAIEHRFVLFLLDSKHRVYTLFPVLYAGMLLPQEYLIRVQATHNKLTKTIQQNCVLTPLPNKFNKIALKGTLTIQLTELLGVQTFLPKDQSKLKLGCIPSNNNCFLTFGALGKTYGFEIGLVYHLSGLIDGEPAEYRPFVRFGLGSSLQHEPKSHDSPPICLPVSPEQCLLVTSTSIHLIGTTGLRKYDQDENPQHLARYRFRKLLQLSDSDYSRNQLRGCIVVDGRCWVLRASRGHYDLRQYCMASDNSGPVQISEEEMNSLLLSVRKPGLEEIFQQIRSTMSRIDIEKQAIQELNNKLGLTSNAFDQATKQRIDAIRRRHKKILQRLQRVKTQHGASHTPLGEYHSYLEAYEQLSKQTERLTTSYSNLEAAVDNTPAARYETELSQLRRLQELASIKRRLLI